jgi:NAD(P)-dependent dehydrogenase (short-subunit alcohol dehydrogenase family)
MIRDDGGEAFACRADLSQEGDNERMVAETVARYGGLDVAMLNAALLGQVAGFFEGSVENFDRVMAVNLRGTWLGLRAVGRAIRPEGAVVVMSSTAGLNGWSMNAPYSASKHALIGLVRSAAEAFAARRARINAICPGTINTRMSQADPDAAPPAETPLVPPSQLTMPAWRGLAPTQHVAELVLYLASSRAAFITGAVHTIDGGLTTGF